MKNIKSFTLATMAASLLCFGLLIGIEASAADKNPCSEDIAKFCNNLKPGMTALMDCLEEHESKLSVACKDYEAKMLGVRVERSEDIREKRKFRQSCTNDIAKFCQDANPAQGGLIKCLKEHENEISASCSDSIKAMEK